MAADGLFKIEYLFFDFSFECWGRAEGGERGKGNDALKKNPFNFGKKSLQTKRQSWKWLILGKWSC